MKTSIPLLILLMILFGAAGQAQTPTFSEWFSQKKTATKYKLQQIAAYEVYLDYLKQGYKFCNKGLSTLSDIKNGTFNLDKDYFNSLQNVSPVVRNSPLVNEILVYRKYIASTLYKLSQDCQADENFTPAEVDFVASVESQMNSRCDASISELTVITTAGAAEMKDDERLNRLDSLNEVMKARYSFTVGFANDTRLLSLDRTKEKSEIQTMRRLYKIDP